MYRVTDPAEEFLAEAERLGKVKLGSASISFKSLEDVDLEVLSEMVAEAAKKSPA